MLRRKRLWRRGWKTLLGLRGGDPAQKHPLSERLSHVSSSRASALPLPLLLSAAAASLHWGPGVWHHPACSEALGCLGAQCALGGQADKSEQEKGRTGKMLLSAFSPGLSGGFFCMSDLLQQDEANSRHADCPLAVSSKPATFRTTPCPFMGISLPWGAWLFSLPVLRPRALCLPQRLAGSASTSQSWPTLSPPLICRGPVRPGKVRKR